MSEQMYLKCVSVNSMGEDLFTQGCVYKAEHSAFSEDQFRVINDKGNPAHVPLTGYLWQFKIVPEPTQEQPKLTPQSLGCFQEVADVVGEANAEIELQKVLDAGLITEPSCVETDEVSGAFGWIDSPQGHMFWENISEGYIPEELRTNHHQISTNGGNGSDNSKPKSAPVFGDVLHINGVRYVFIRVDNDGDYMATDDEGNFVFVALDWFDEYKPDPTQELREQILKDWQQQGLEWSHDTEVCRVDMSVGDIIDFILLNGYRKES